MREGLSRNAATEGHAASDRSRDRIDGDRPGRLPDRRSDRWIMRCRMKNVSPISDDRRTFPHRGDDSFRDDGERRWSEEGWPWMMAGTSASRSGSYLPRSSMRDSRQYALFPSPRSSIRNGFVRQSPLFMASGSMPFRGLAPLSKIGAGLIAKASTSLIRPRSLRCRSVLRNGKSRKRKSRWHGGPRHGRLRAVRRHPPSHHRPP